jgi:hypothetical protein
MIRHPVKLFCYLVLLSSINNGCKQNPTEALMSRALRRLETDSTKLKLIKVSNVILLSCKDSIPFIFANIETNRTRIADSVNNLVPLKIKELKMYERTKYEYKCKKDKEEFEAMIMPIKKQVDDLNLLLVNVNSENGKGTPIESSLSKLRRFQKNSDSTIAHVYKVNYETNSDQKFQATIYLLPNESKVIKIVKN